MAVHGPIPAEDQRRVGRVGGIEFIAGKEIDPGQLKWPHMMLSGVWSQQRDGAHRATFAQAPRKLKPGTASHSTLAFSGDDPTSPADSSKLKERAALKGAWLTCPICHIRKEKRFCLALHGRICPQCCGEQREVTLECPAECPYLQQARQHAKPREFGSKLPEELFPSVEITHDFVHRNQPLIAGLLQTVLRLSAADRKLRDREVIGALTSMARSYQTLVASGLVYQEASANPAQLAIIDVLRRSIDEFRSVEQQHLGYTALRDSDVLKALVFIVRLANLETSGRPLSRAFIDALHQRFPEAGPAGEMAAQTGSRIILP